MQTTPTSDLYVIFTTMNTYTHNPKSTILHILLEFNPQWKGKWQEKNAKITLKGLGDTISINILH
jgi:hypothetical protein